MTVQQNGIEPCGKPTTLVVIGQALPGLHQSFRNQVLRRACVATKGYALPKQPAVQRLYQLAKRCGVSLPGLSQERGRVLQFNPLFRDKHPSSLSPATARRFKLSEVNSCFASG